MAEKRIEKYLVQQVIDWDTNGSSLREVLIDEATIDGGRVESVECDGVNFMITVCDDEEGK